MDGTDDDDEYQDDGDDDEDYEDDFDVRASGAKKKRKMSLESDQDAPENEFEQI